jgi:cytoskeletal protein RodZ
MGGGVRYDDCRRDEERERRREGVYERETRRDARTALSICSLQVATFGFLGVLLWIVGVERG